MNTTIEAVKDEVAKKRNYKSGFTITYILEYLGEGEFENVITEIAELYHSRKCEEAGRELPSDESIEEECSKRGLRGDYGDGKANGMKSMKEKASILLATKQGEIEDCKKTITHLMNVGDKIQGELETKDREVFKKEEKIEKLESVISQLRENNSLLSQQKDKDIAILKKGFEILENNVRELSGKLQEAKAEVEKLKIIPEECLCKCSDKQLLRTVYPLPDICEYCCKAVPKSRLSTKDNSKDGKE